MTKAKRQKEFLSPPFGTDDDITNLWLQLFVIAGVFVYSKNGEIVFHPPIYSFYIYLKPLPGLKCL